MQKAARLTIILLLIVHVALLFVFVRNRFIDGDEGFYLSAAREVAFGKTPYIDYCYPQMPLLPYIYSPVSECGFDTLYYARYLSLLATILTAGLMIVMLRQQTANDASVTLAFALYVFSGLILSWHSTAKTYPWTNLLLLAGLFSAFRFSVTRGYGWACLCGAAFGLAANIRLTLLPLILPATIFIAANARERKLRGLAACLIGVLAVSVPSLSLLAQDPQRFLFDNFGFHLIRNPGVGFWQSIPERLFVIGKLVINPQIAIILLVLAASFLSLRREQSPITFKSLFHSRDQFVFLMVGLIVLIHILPNPIHQQYFTQAVPFAVLLIPSGLNYIMHGRARFRYIAGFVKLACVIYVLGLVPYLAIFLGGIRERDRPHRIGNIQALCSRIDSENLDGPLYSEWPVIPVLSARGSIEGLEFIAYDYGYELTDSEKRHYHLPVSGDINQMLAERVPSFCVVYDAPHPDFHATMYENYELVGSFGKYKLYRRR